MEPIKSRSFFHPRLSSAIEITKDNKENVEALVQEQVKKGWRWVSADFINDEGYDSKRGYSTDCRVAVHKKDADKSTFEKEGVDIVLINPSSKGEDKAFFFINSKGELDDGTCYTSDAEKLAASFKIKSDGLELRCNPVFKARQMPKLKKGDWVAIQGKTLRVIKKSDDLTIEKLKKHKPHVESDVEGIFLPKHFFEDGYARLAGSYIRRLERFGYLKEAFEQFFYKRIVKLPVEKAFDVRLATGKRLCGEGYKSYIQLTLSKEILTPEDLRLLEKALGIRLDAEKLGKNSTIENTVPFKKVLEILTCYTTSYIHPCNAKNIPILVHFLQIEDEKVEFLLSVDKDNVGQLIISRKKDDKHYIGNSYTFWLNSPNNPDAETAEFVLNNTFEIGKEKIKDWGIANISKIRNLIEFLACTQLVEAHATPGQLQKSRVPGMGKLARSLIKEAKENNMPLSDFFHAKNKEISEAFYPMATNGGTGNGRNVVNNLTRINKPTEDGEIVEWENNAPDYDMSADSEVEFENPYQS